MKILHILDHSIPLHSGYTFRTRAILEQQRKLGWETAHITSSKHSADYQETEEVDGLLFYRTRPSESALASLPLMNQLDVINSLTKRLDQVIAIEQPDILHAHSPSLNGIAAIRAGRKHNLPVVYECRAFWEDAAVDHGTSKEWGLRYRITRALETYTFKNADAVTTICGGLKGDIQARGIRADKITVIPNAVDLVHFSQRQDANDLQLSDELKLTDKNVLGFIGSFYAYEGLMLLVSALPDILKKAPDTRLLLVGGGPDDAKLKQLSNELGLQDKVIFTGRVPHAEVTRYYDLVDIFVYPRLHMRLTDLVTPLKPLEAMAQEKLVLASDVGGHRELIRDGENGRLFSAGDKTSLAKIALDMIKQADESNELRRKGLEYVEKERNWVVSVTNYKNVYSALVAGE
ncbi:MAG: glycosyltransferase, exosortase A system-associated [Sedimenticola thiotaurini]|uniref:Glycosyltransferase, exosortase A system-associated n=1 Tax=Sedimenticola thiotaurini TaxID=1543721 RepID=A0A558D552_9GAMM|nr:MAG: glycosyltransferase, exosortase A system-associated [Sedimenticola thiotaurini]